MPSALIAIEQYFPKELRIVDDSLVVRLLPLGARGFVRCLGIRPLRDWLIAWSEKSNPGLWGGLLCRKRYIEDRLLEARDEVEAFVNLGAGFDCSPYRLSALAGMPIWELDQPENIQVKRSALTKALGTIPRNIQLVKIDFDRDDLSAVLESHGYSPKNSTFFIWEAVTQYLTESGVRSTFDFLAGTAAGSRLVFTYDRKDFLEGKALYGWEGGYTRFVKSEIWRFGIEPERCAAFLEKYGWRCLEDRGYGEMAERYIVPTGRALTATPVERIVYAVKI
jgi:methyltransferase (TIGR00027 family)